MEPHVIPHNPAKLMTTVQEYIDPQKANTYLARNISNRRLRPRKVRRYCIDMKNGAWVVSHQGIAFDTHGNLLDGQHRLLAIIESGVGQWLSVTRNALPESFKVIDQMEPRNAADILSLNPVDAALVTFGLTFISQRGKPTVQQLEYMDDAIGDIAISLTKYAPRTTRVWSSAPVRFGALCNILAGGDEDYILQLYRSFTLGNVDELPPIGVAFVKRYINGRLNFDKFALAAVSYYAFKEKNRNKTRLFSGSDQPYISEMRTLVRNAYTKVGGPALGSVV